MDQESVSLKPTVRIFLRNWWPVAVWLVVIRLESTSFASAGNTFRLLYRVLYFFFGRIDVRLVFELDHILRKSGHFLGYAVLSGLTYGALRNTYRDRYRSLRGVSWGDSIGHWWQCEWSLVSVLLTMVTAASDEIHQASLPSRTGRWQDVMIDTSGAVALQAIIYVSCRLHAPARRPKSLIAPQSAAREKLPFVESE
jgi:VanZ family protein